MKEIKIKINTLKCIAVILFISVVIGMSILVIDTLGIKLSKPATVYYEPDESEK